MSTVMQLISAVTATQRQIDDQVMKLSGLGTQIDEAKTQTATVLAGSSKGYDAKIAASLDQAKQRIDSTIVQLEQAKSSLQQVQMI
jgi:pyrroline-5-carboxylate reductase